MGKIEQSIATTRVLDLLEGYPRNEALKVLEECIYFVDMRKDLFK